MVENLPVDFGDCTFDEDMYPSCQSKPDILETFLQNSLRTCYPHGQSAPDYCSNPSPMDRERYMPPGNFSPHNPGQPADPSQQPLTNQWESVNVRDVDLQDLKEVAEDLIYSEAQNQLARQSGQTPVPQHQPQEVISYMPMQVKQETEVYERQQQYSPFLDSSASENSFRSGCEQSPHRDESVRKERRREQNRRAARKCREKKKRHQDTLIKSYEGLRGENNKLKEEVDQLRKDMAILAELLQKHEATCPYGHTLPKVPAHHLPASSQPGAKRLQQAGKYLQSAR